MPYAVEMRLDVKIPMRDGVKLSADIYLPKAAGPFPVVLVRTPYNNNLEPAIEKARSLANTGYAVVLQDVRGRWDSEGEFYPFQDEALDGFDTQEWIGRQSWSSGKIGMSGASYLAAVQWASAPLGSEYLTCLAPRVMCNDYFNELIYPGGAFHLNVAATWGMRTRARTAQTIAFHNWTEAFHTLPLVEFATQAGDDVGFWRDWIEHSTDDEYWAKLNFRKQFDQISVPAFEMSGWFDLYAQHAFTNFNTLRERGTSPATRQSKLIVGPWPHHLSGCTCTGDIDFGAHSMVDLEDLELRWFDYWLKGKNNGILDDPPIRLFIMGINEWRDEHEWPLARTVWQKWYLHSAGAANTVLGDGQLATKAPGDEPPDEYDYDPRYPAQTLGGNNCCSPHIVPWGPYDQRPVEMRNDVLCYTGPVLQEDLEVTGPIQMTLYATSDRPDTDWTAKLVDVSPSGYAMNLCDGIIRARYRESRSDPTPIQPGTVYEYTIDVGATGNVFRKGHRIRLEISSSNFPRFDRNPNTGHAIGKDAELHTAHQTIHHSTAYPSHILLPVIPAKN